MLTNGPLLRALRAREKPFVVATNGFYPIVEPLLTEMGCADAELIACRLEQPSDRIGGKAALVRARLGDAARARFARLGSSRTESRRDHFPSHVRESVACSAQVPRSEPCRHPQTARFR